MTSPLHQLLDSPDFPEGRAWRRLRFSPGQNIVEEGDIGKQLFVLLDGTVRVAAKVVIEGTRQLRPGYCDLGPGAIFGELCLFDDEPRSASVIAVSEAEVAVIDGGVLTDFLEHHPDIGYFVLKEIIHILVERLRTANRRFVSIFGWGLKVHQIDKHL